MGTLSDIEADWPRISALLDEAMSRAVAEREAFIDALTAPDDCFRDTLRELLALQAKAETEDFMEALPVIPGLLTGPWPHEAGAGTASTFPSNGFAASIRRSMIGRRSRSTSGPARSTSR